jgi:TonB-dependent SusC/RagA subfamily outer membrane receptor
MRDDARRALVLAHEGEHVRAADPRLLAVGALLVALAPWNPALWWQLRRLRAAVEVDCDRRVLARHPDVRRYGRLLLDVAARAAGPGALAGSYALAPSFALTLDRRIRTMTSRPPRRPLAHAASALVGALAVLAAAAALPRPAAAVDAASDLRVTAAPTAAAQDSTRPLMLVNGREVSPDSPEANPAPDRIERVDVLKGETAIARYGARGRHGVILITMKPGAAATGESSTAREASPERLDVRRREIADQQVLWVVNGRVIPPPPGRTHSDGPPESLPQADRIARVNVLKGEAARRKYGERVPRDGVVEITTKAASET